MSDERRLRKRVNLSVYLAATDAAIDKPMGNLIDLSAAGFLLLTDQDISQTGDVSINIQLPNPIENVSFINVIAKFIRSKPSAKPLYHECAFEITYATSQTKRIIEELQQHWHLHFPNT
jgi:PilZ domain